MMMRMTLRMPCARQPLLLLRRFSARPPRESLRDRNRALALTLGAVVVGAVGLSYAAVPLYRMFCQVTGFDGKLGRLWRDGKESTVKVTLKASTPRT